MISAWWLLVICPVCIGIGFFYAALCHAASKRDNID